MQYIKTNKRIEIIENAKIVAFADIEGNIIKNIYVEEEYRNISYGRNVLTKAIEVIKRQGFDEVIVKEFDNATYSFLKKQNFKIQNNCLVYSGLKKEILQEKSILNTSIIAFIINLFLATAKLSIGFLFNLSSITADGLNAASDCVTNFLVIIGLKISNKTEDELHPFGYGKIESIFSIIIGNIIIYSAVKALIDTIKKLFGTYEPIQLGSKVILILSFSTLFIVIKISQYFYVKYIATKYNNILLNAIIKDYLSDILVSFSVLIGTILSIYFTRLFDIVLGIVITMYIIYQGIMIIYENSLSLMDTQNKELLEEIKQIILSDDRIKFVHDLVMISYANDIYVFGDIRVNKSLSVEISHEIAEKISLTIRKKINVIKRVTLHVEPIY